MCDVLRMFWLIIIYNVSLFPPFVSIPLALPHLLTFLFPKSGFSMSLLLCKLLLLQRPFLTILSKVAPLFILSHLSFLSLYPSQFAVVHLFALITCSLSFSTNKLQFPSSGILGYFIYHCMYYMCLHGERNQKIFKNESLSPLNSRGTTKGNWNSESLIILQYTRAVGWTWRWGKEASLLPKREHHAAQTSWFSSPQLQK